MLRLSYHKTKTRELNTPALSEEELDVIEVLDHRALFSNGRIKPEQIPEGLPPMTSAIAMTAVASAP